VEAMYLVCLHPNLPSYQLLSVPDLSEEVAALFALRKKQLVKSNNKSIADYFSKKSI
jgi:hypothetical protein